MKSLWLVCVWAGAIRRALWVKRAGLEKWRVCDHKSSHASPAKVHVTCIFHSSWFMNIIHFQRALQQVYVWCWQTVSLSELWPFQEFCGVQVVGVNSELCLKVQRVPNLHFPSWSQWILMNLVLDCTFPWTASTFIYASFSSLWKDALTCQLKKGSAQIRTRWCTAGFRLQLLSLK